MQTLGMILYSNTEIITTGAEKMADSVRPGSLRLHLHSSDGDSGTGALWEGRDGPRFCARGGGSDVIDRDVDLRADGDWSVM